MKTFNFRIGDKVWCWNGGRVQPVQAVFVGVRKGEWVYPWIVTKKDGKKAMFKYAAKTKEELK